LSFQAGHDMTVPRLATDDGNCITRTATPNRRMLLRFLVPLEQNQGAARERVAYL
jgi:hypothetical protein